MCFGVRELQNNPESFTCVSDFHGCVIRFNITLPSPFKSSRFQEISHLISDSYNSLSLHLFISVKSEVRTPMNTSMFVFRAVTPRRLVSEDFSPEDGDDVFC